jgi:uncharacterized protein (TIGR02246 family)
MRALRFSTLLCGAALFCGVVLFCAAASAAAPANNTAAIKQVLQDQQAAWNRGDIPAFMHGYKNSPETTFISKTIEHGYQPILKRYEAHYATRAAMGALEFSDLTVKMLGKNYAVATGRFHLTRTAAAGGDASGIFSLTFEREPEGWRIILDHTSSN